MEDDIDIKLSDLCVEKIESNTTESWVGVFH